MMNFKSSKSIYNDSNRFILFIEDYKIDGNKISFEFDGDEKLVGSFYLDTIDELNYYKEKIKYGIKVEVIGDLREPINNTIPNNFNYKHYLESKGIYYILDINEIKIIDNKTNFIYGVKNFVNDRIISADKTGYMKAFILGDKSLIDEEMYAKYQKIGVTHLFALSGMHVGLLSGIVLFVLRRLKDKHKYLILDVLLVFYGFIVGFPSSIKRCILFFIINSINKIFKINLSTIKILLIVIFILILNDYKIIYDVGFRYSIATVLGILLAEKFINDKSKLRSSFKLSLVAFLFSLPISLSNFYEVNLLSILYNVLYVPYVSLVVYPLSLISFIFPFLNIFFHFSIIILEYVTEFLSNIKILNFYLDFNEWEVYAFYVLLFLIFYKGYKKLIVLIFIIGIFDVIFPYFDSRGYVYFFDVGQGDSSLIISPYRKDVILIDTGGIVSYEKEEWQRKRGYNVSDGVITFLKSKGIKKIDLLILSHADSDHAKDVGNICEEIDVRNLKINEGEINKYEKIALELIEGREYEAKGLELNYLNFKEYNDENANSVLTMMNIYNTKILTFGDATKEAEDDVVKKFNLGNIDIVKLSHHGSKTSSSKYYLSRINPSIAIISSGRNNRFKHPSSETIQNLEELKIKYLNTQQSGTIKFVISQNGVTYNEYKP